MISMGTLHFYPTGGFIQFTGKQTLWLEFRKKY